MTSEQFPLNDTPESASPEDPQVSNPWEGPIIPLRFDTPAEQSPSTSTDRYYERGSEAIDRLGNMLSDATEGPREAAKAKLRKLGRGASAFFSTIKGAARPVLRAPVVAFGAGVTAGEAYLSNTKANVNTIFNLAETAKAETSGFINDKSDAIRVNLENNRDAVKDIPNKTKRGLGGIALGFQNFRRNRQENTIAKQEQRLAKSKEELSDINQGIVSSLESQSIRERNTADVRAEARKRREVAEAREEERRNKRAQLRQMGQSA